MTDHTQSVAPRYQRNLNAFAPDELEIIAGKRVCILGCGGLGGHVVSSLARFGVGSLVLVDGDVFDETNLNRQIFADTKTLGKNKAVATKAALTNINPEVEVLAVAQMFTAENGADILAGCDLVVDCLDSLSARFVAAHCCTARSIPMVHGAIAGWYGQVANIFPGESLLELIYPASLREEKGIEVQLGNPPFIPQIVAAVQCSEALKILANKENILHGGFLYIDLIENTMEKIDLV